MWKGRKGGRGGRGLLGVFRRKVSFGRLVLWVMIVVVVVEEVLFDILVGRFLKPRSADDILFGNVFERPLKLPWGFSAALKFMKYVSSLSFRPDTH